MFKTQNEFCLYLEQLKLDHGFDTFIETIAYYAEHESDHEMDHIVKHLNKRIRDAVRCEATDRNLLKDANDSEPLF